MRVGNLLNLWFKAFFSDYFAQVVLLFIVSVLKCTAVYVLASMCGLVGVFKEGSSLLAF